MKFLTKKYEYLADLNTPVGIYLRLRDVFRETILLESADYSSGNNSKSIIAINPIAGIELRADRKIEVKFPDSEIEMFDLDKPISSVLNDFKNSLKPENLSKDFDYAQGLYGYMAYDAVQYFENLEFRHTPSIPLFRYRFYQYVIVLDHHKQELCLYENKVEGVSSRLREIQSLIQNRDVPIFPFRKVGNETSNQTDENYLDLVNKGIQHCLRGDVFQIVLSRRFSQSYEGDEFQVYRALRSINPSPYLYYFDYTDYKIFGSSPESQIMLQDGEAKIHPIAGTFKRTGDDAKDAELSKNLLSDEKENAEHTMLVDLARNDLSKFCKNVRVTKYKEIQWFSHVIHMVSEVKGDFTKSENPFDLIAATFPQGTLSGSPKHRALEIIDQLEPTSREYYGGCIGFVGLNGSLNKAITIRSFLAKENKLHYQAGAGVVEKSIPENERKEVLNKLGALTKAIDKAEKL
ncbi:anthranilate synthase component I family protein [Ornithobacterium rhinotracheale]|uniref:Anthranilate synthase component 1 n=1 Tax=Ornithobacterium rhinotracheale TaxID=28251 RepID=A0A410JPV0_ORNRH|nr:anthranilate synthase component I family protein [Ornithobacterium rhinotracheale]QAR30152.1 anthranilate synthase component I family protein [Ornithobacterium rhinotracheale]